MVRCGVPALLERVDDRRGRLETVRVAVGDVRLEGREAFAGLRADGPEVVAAEGVVDGCFS